MVTDLLVGRRPEFMVVNWDGVMAASPSFVDEFVGGISVAMNEITPEGRMIFLRDNPDLIEMVGDILKRRGVTVGFVHSLEELGTGHIVELGAAAELSGTACSPNV